MGIKCGIVGLPNVGKSTLFNALTNAQNAAAENYPFCTIDPNVGIVPVPDARLDALAAIVKPNKVVATTVEFVDIAGLVAGASKGEGLGNQFLGHIRETDAIAHVTRCFVNDDIIHVAGGVDPIRDIEIINTELALADLDSVTKAIERNGKLVRAGNKDAQVKQDVLMRVQERLNEGRAARSLELNADEKLMIRDLMLITAKPALYIANVDETSLKEGNENLRKVQAYAAAEGAQVVAVCAAIEAEIGQLDDADKAAFLADLGLEEPGLNRVIRAGYTLLGLQTYFTAGVQEGDVMHFRFNV